MKEKIQLFKEKISTAKNIAIFAHITPDGDAIGSSCALALYLRKQGIDAYVYLQEEVPDEYKYFKLDDLIIIGKPNNYDLLIATDCASLDRLGTFAPLFMEFENTIAIDHHYSFIDFAQLNLVNDLSSSASEFLYDIMKLCGFECDKRIAEFLYLGILRDTGGFMHSCTTSHTFTVTSELLNFGLDIENINRHFMLTTTKRSAMLLKEALNGIKFFDDDKIAISAITQDYLKKYNAKLDDTASIINNLLSISTVEVAVLLAEVNKNTFKVSFRAKNDVDVSEIAKVFGGGGHKKASGCQVYGSLSKVLQMLLNAVKGQMKV